MLDYVDFVMDDALLEIFNNSVLCTFIFKLKTTPHAPQNITQGLQKHKYKKPNTLKNVHKT